MPSPEELPYIEGGTIWDGETQYNVWTRPDHGTAWACRMYMDGTRRFSDVRSTNRPNEAFERVISGYGWNRLGIGYAIVTPVNSYDYGRGFLNYDGTLSYLDNPPNQHYQIQLFREHAARAAHQLNAAMGFDVLTSASEEDRLTVKQVLSAMIGVAARRYATWEKVDPQEIIHGGTYDGTLLWKRYLQDYIDTDLAICGQCDIDHYAQEFYYDADLPAFRVLWRQGIIYAPDHSLTEKWNPVDFAIADGPVGAFHDELDAHYDLMVRHWSKVVGPAERQRLASLFPS